VVRRKRKEIPPALEGLLRQRSIIKVFELEAARQTLVANVVSTAIKAGVPPCED